MKDVAVVFLVAAYNLVVLVGCAWLVWNGWSAWWFLLAIGIMASVESSNEKDK